VGAGRKVTPAKRCRRKLLEAVEARRLRRVARPNPEQAEIIAALGLTLPECICADHDITPKESAVEPHSTAALRNG